LEAALLALPAHRIADKRTLPTPEILETKARNLRGHYGYYGVADNS